MNALAQSPWFWFPLIAVLGAVYFLPTIIGSIRNVEGLGWLALFNVFFPGVGFLAGLILAFGLPRRELPAAYPPPAYYPYYPPPPGQDW
jgi:hypothetical protein